MTYTALYRRYRPDTFDTLIGQAHVAKVLRAAVARDNIVHAYLFCGPRGTGKTSSARILARAINCLTPEQNGNPCGKCAACLRSLAGESMDIIEIDGASNRGIDEIRDLRERVKYAPAQEKYKIYIIDEVHMLTNDAFNAILKTLEEPPSHVIFIFATTAPHKLPLTVLSRCQRFDFRRISDEEICAHLLDIAAHEQISISKDAAALIAKKADGGMRDAVSLLDQCAAAAEADIESSTVAEILGIVDRDFISGLEKSLLAKDISSALAAIEVLITSGKDLRQALSDLLELLRDDLLAAMKKDKTEQANSPYTPQNYLDLLSALADTDNKLRFAASPRITLELALIKACGLTSPPLAKAGSKAVPAAAKVAQETVPQAKQKPPVSQDSSANAVKPTSKTKTSAPASEAAPESVAPDNMPKMPTKQQEQDKEAAAELSATKNIEPELPEEGDIRAQLAETAWQKALLLIEKANKATYFRIEYCRVQAIEGGIKLLFPAGCDADCEYIMTNGEHLQVIKDALKTASGESWQLQGTVGSFTAPQEEAPAPPKPLAAEETAPAEQEIKQSSLF